jgi:hypothetical protein
MSSIVREGWSEAELLGGCNIAGGRADGGCLLAVVFGCPSLSVFSQPCRPALSRLLPQANCRGTSETPPQSMYALHGPDLFFP